MRPNTKMDIRFKFKGIHVIRTRNENTES